MYIYTYIYTYTYIHIHIHIHIPVSLVCPFLPILSVGIFSILGEIGDKSVENFSQNLSLADIGRKFWSEVKKSLISVEIALNAFEIKKNQISHKLAVIIVRTNISSTLFYKNRVRVDCWCSNNIVKVSGTN